MLGIFGGTFDPIHYGHLRPALEVQQALGLKQVLFVPLGVAVHRAQPIASAALRLAMVQIAVMKQPEFVADDREIRRATPSYPSRHSCPSYTIDTLVQLHQEKPDSKLCLLIGDDAFQHFFTWRKPLDILQLAHLIVMQRPGVTALKNMDLAALLAERQWHNPQSLSSSPPGRIIMQPVTQLAISSSAIRTALATGNSVRFLLPNQVLKFIYSQGIYQT
jgi:nicotinate-nucleotide adenylyltransferase